MDDKEFAFMRTLDRPTVEQLRREIARVDAARKLTASPEEDFEEQEEEPEETGRGRLSRRQKRKEK